MRIINRIKPVALVSAMTFLPMQMNNILKAQTPVKDEFVLNTDFRLVSPQGTTDFIVLTNAPSSDVYVKSELKKAIIVVDLSKNVLYKYDQDGNPTEAFLVASGKKSTPTSTGVRVVSHVETYPYRTAPKATKRRRNPRDYGPKIIILNELNPTNGIQSPCGEFIHGNNNPSSIGKYASKGCIRMDNEVIKELSTQVQRGDIVKIIR